MAEKLDYSKLDKASAEPEASSMIETFRAIGYSIETAVADIIDNSITAGAQNIWIDYEWNGPNTHFSILDDGHGMNGKELIHAMRPGSSNPLDTREANDLGRFGLGLKTASFSQTRKFSVISKRTDYKSVCWCWDLDFVNMERSWTLINYCPKESRYRAKVDELTHGTMVVWWDLDRLTKDSSVESEEAKNKFFKTMETIKRHLEMVFHRFIEHGLKIYFRGRPVEAWDPFLIGFKGLQPKPENLFEDGKISVQGFVLPHRSMLTPEEYEFGKGPMDSWTGHQGFYVYRRKRLLVPGDWLGLFKKELHYDLCRIRIDLPNDFDQEWQIDIKKSVAVIPNRWRDTLESYAKDTRAQAVAVYRHKGQVVKRMLKPKDYHPFWEEKTRHGKRFYKINREHPLITDLKIKGTLTYPELNNLLQFVEETVPVPLISLQESEDKDPHGKPFEGKKHDLIHDAMTILYKSYLSEGFNPQEAKSKVANTEPFNFYLEYLEKL